MAPKRRPPKVQKLLDRLKTPPPNGEHPGLDPSTGDPDQADAINEVLTAIADDVGKAVSLALRHAETLARLKEGDPVRLELLYNELQQAGAKDRAITGLQRAVNAAVKRQRQRSREQEAARREEAQREERRRLAEQGFSNFVVVGKDRQGLPIQDVTARLNALTGGWPRRIDNLLFAENPGPQPLWIESHNALFAWVSRHLPGGSLSLLDWAQGPTLVTESRLYHYLGQNAECFDALECYPHHPPLPRHWYMHPDVEPGKGKHLAQLLRFFRPATTIDGDLIKAFFLTLLWGGSPGQRPAWLFTAEDNDAQGGRGVGKSTIGQMAGRLLGGYITLSTSDTYRDLVARILSPKAMLQRVVLLDNLKAMRLSWAELEALITADSISGYRLYHGEGRRTNTLTVVLTVNGASVSKDLAQRCVIITVKRPAYSPKWRTEIEGFIDRHRWGIIGDILGELRKPARTPEAVGRWGLWEAEVLARACPELADAQKVIRERQESVDDDDAESDLVRDHFLDALRELKHGDPNRLVYFIPADRAAAWLNQATREKRTVPKASIYLGNLNIPELQRGKGGESRRRGFWWKGRQSHPNARPIIVGQKEAERGGEGAPWEHLKA